MSLYYSKLDVVCTDVKNYYLFTFSASNDMVAVEQAIKVSEVPCAIIQEYDDGTFKYHVRTLGETFLKNLTDAQAAYVYSTNSDVFWYNPSEVLLIITMVLSCLDFL